MRKYPLHDLNDEEFENLTILICRKVLGEAVVPFASGTDGGRDGRFHGKANSFPSDKGPWDGKIVIEARFDEAGEFKNGLAVVKLNGEVTLINRNGKVVYPLGQRRIKSIRAWDTAK